MRTGIDITRIKRFKKFLKNEKFLNKVFTEKEIEHILQNKTEIGKLERIAGKFCAKEAILKALGTGIGNGIKLKEIEILSDENLRPKVFLYSNAKQKFAVLKLNEIDISISHDAGMAIAICVVC